MAPYPNHRDKNKKIWMRHYQKLVDYRKVNGHSSPPKSYSDQKLVNWIAKQRKLINQLSEEKRELLEKIGFVWNATEFVLEKKMDGPTI